MKPGPASAIIIAAMLSYAGSLAVNACGSRIDLAAIEQRIADPNLDGDLKDKASLLKTRAASAIEAGHRDEGRKTYHHLQALLGIAASSGPYRCN